MHVGGHAAPNPRPRPVVVADERAKNGIDCSPGGGGGDGGGGGSACRYCMVDIF